MEFDISAFEKASFTARTKEIPVPDLAPFFNDLKEGEQPVWVVRGITGHELASVNEEQDRSKNVQAVVEALVAGQPEHITEVINDLIGQGDDVPADLARRQALLVAGSVKPTVSRKTAVKMAEAFPIEFYQLTSAIIELTGQGSVPGKPKRSSKSRTSK